MNKYSNLDRKDRLIQSASEVYDLVVIGGGVTGAGIALDASLNGFKTLLIEKSDFASGTSSRSTKLIHGGLRYLKQLEFGLVKESGLERAIVHKLAPHLVHPEKMLLPIVKKGSFSKLAASFAISVYDFLAKVEDEDKKKNFNKAKTLNLEPLLNPAILKAGVQYSEYRTDDARLTMALINSAINLGCDAYNYLFVESFNYDSDTDQIKSLNVNDEMSNETYTINCKQVVSAAGPWVDQLRRKDGSLTGKRLRPSKGSHIVVPYEKLPLYQSVYFDDFKGRMIFAIPRLGVTYIGTTDENYEGDPDKVFCSVEEASYLLDAANHIFPDISLSHDDIVSSWAGLRPLIHEEGKSPTELSRKDEIFISKSGLISIAGGKLTGYRKMAERIVKLLMERAGQENVHQSTEHTELSRDGFLNYTEVIEYRNNLEERLAIFGLNQLDAAHLVQCYGRDSEWIVGKMNELQSSYEDPYELLVISELDYTIEHEMTIHLLDFFNRRTGRLYFKLDDVIKYKTIVSNRLAERLNLSESQMKKQSEELEEAITHCLACKHL